MAVPDPQLRYATDVFDADGVTTDWQISFTGGYINPSHVYAMSGLLDEETQLLTDRTPHTVEVLSEDDDASTVRVSPAVAAGRKLYIYRSTPVQQMLVDYVNGSIISKTNLNLSNDQLLKIIQEMFDSLNIATLSIDQQVGVIVDLNEIIQNIYKQVTELLAAGGIVSVAPRVWSGAWADDQVDDTDFDMVGADVSGAGFYDVYVNGIGMQPDVDYQVTLADGTDPSFIRFATVPAEGSIWFAVLRGYAKPYTGPAPLTAGSLRVPITQAVGPTFYADKAVEYGLVRCTYSAGCAVTINAIPAVGDSETKLGAGSYFSFQQKAGPVTVTADSGVILEVPAGCIAATRAVNSVVTATCVSGDTNTWLLSGDLAKE
ncbi:tail fiber protein [Xanthomonas phage P4]|uniref:Tail fiber protein n=1 Tax=Xanthomonas phage P4 TaxID=3003372 RepID=A0AAE9VLY2_9CAUD|nr:tail fiber protein [Xanthomonas phage GF2]WAX24158.1 tail fiber protein [Xanthomonas phage GF1]WAX24168.1 tail fiber protein [Xanthomonas phage P4]WAX24244.1 tail fiber protein [Xanthomonas phage S3]